MSRASALKRLMTEYKQLVSNGSPDGMFTAGPISEDDFFTWEALIEGPKDTPFEGGVFLAKLTFVSRISRVSREHTDDHFCPKSRLITLSLHSK